MMTIHIKTISSGSKGNCYKISDGETVLMIECGIQFKKIREAFCFKLTGVSGCLVSHEHQDHCKSIQKVMNSGIDCYTSKGTADTLNLSGHRLKIVENKKQFKVGSFTILPFDTVHDCAEPFGFLIQSGDEKVLFATDTYFIKYRFQNVTHFIIEANFSRSILHENIKRGLIHPSLQKRIMRSHFDITRVKEFFIANDLSKAKEVHLIHLSDLNSDEKLFKREIQAITGLPVFVH